MKRLIPVLTLATALALSGCSSSGPGGAGANGASGSTAGQGGSGAPPGGYGNPLTGAELKAASQGTALSCPDDPHPPTAAQKAPDMSIFDPTEVLECTTSGVAVTFYIYPDVLRSDGARKGNLEYWCDNVSNTPPAAIGAFTWSAFVDDPTDPAGAAALQATVDALGPIATLENPTCP